MSMRFSIFTKVIAVVLVVAVCMALMPSKVFSDPCERERNLKYLAYTALIATCGTAGWRCAVAILGPNPITVGLCVFSAIGCGGAVWAYVAAASAYKDCMNNQGVAYIN